MISNAGAVNDPDASLVADAGYLCARSESYPRRRGFQIIDVLEPTTPVLIGHYDPDGIGEIEGFSKRIDRGRFAPIDDSGVMRLVDIADPMAPREVARSEVPYPLTSIVENQAPFVVLGGHNYGVLVGPAP